MQRDKPPIRLTVPLKLTLAYGGIAIVAIVLGELAALLLPPTGGAFTWLLHVIFVTGIGLAVALLLSGWLTHSLGRRLHRYLEIGRAWLRGNLALRLHDPQRDELGALGRQLDLLAAHLEEDEEDLEALRERNDRLTDQVRALAVVEERNRVARELHDSVKQHLFSLTMTAGALRTRLQASEEVSAGVEEMLQEIEEAARAAQRETTRLIKDLRPASLQERGLADALNDYTLLFGAQEHLLIYLEVEGNDDLLPPSLTETLYRVAQEALHNIARHSRATRVDVRLQCFPELVSLTLADNGIGFNVERAQRGLGLVNMQERLLKSGGRLQVESTPGEGTRVTAEVALGHSLESQADLRGGGRHRPRPDAENWAWLGQKLMIPVGQTWPWQPADQSHLRRPLVEPALQPLRITTFTGLLGLIRYYDVLLDDRCLVTIHRKPGKYEWEDSGAVWALKEVSDLSGRAVLVRNGQPLAAMQYQGRQIHTWSEIVYDGRAYRLAYVSGEDETPCNFVLEGETGERLLCAQGKRLPSITLKRALPLPLLIMALARVIDEAAQGATAPSQNS
ncbi:MAG: histidine kinase [Anaerolineales bacterium]